MKNFLLTQNLTWKMLLVHRRLEKVINYPDTNVYRFIPLALSDQELLLRVLRYSTKERRSLLCREIDDGQGK